MTWTRRRVTYHSGRNATGFRFELLEARRLLTTYQVLNNADSGPGSLRAAITAVNADTLPDTIDFNLSGTLPQSIVLVTPLPAIANRAFVDGTTEPGYAGKPLVVLDGTNLSQVDSDLEVLASSSEVEGIAFVSCPGNGLGLSGTDGVVIEDCYFGTADGATASPNQFGLVITNSTATTISGNLVSGNSVNGIVLGPGNSGTLIQSNLIGTDATGESAVSNESVGLYVNNSSGTTIGGLAASQGNLISGNLGTGIELVTNGVNFQSEGNPGDSLQAQPREGTVSAADSGAGTLIVGNIVGLNREGTRIIGTSTNNVDGIMDLADLGSTIGGTTAAARNVVSGFGYFGLDLRAPDLVEGNYIGTDMTGKAALGNISGGVKLTGSSTIGGSVQGSGNVISGNGGPGITTVGLPADQSNLIEGNFIGVDVSGSVAMPNSGSGISVSGDQYVTIGGTTPGAANVISANRIDGINLTLSSPAGTVVLGNDIGTDLSGTLKLGNASDGIYINADQQIIGGMGAGAGNVIAYNGNAGIELSASNQQGTFLSNSIFGNANGGISFANAYPTANHPNEQGVPSPAPNDFQNYPVLSSATTDGTTTEVLGSLNAGANTTYTLQFFASPQADSRGFGQGQALLDTRTVTTGTRGSDANDVIFEFIVSKAVQPGWVISATATDPDGNTSEFAKDVPVQAIGDVGVTISSVPALTAYVNQVLTYTVTVSENGPAAASGVVVSDTLPAGVALVSTNASIAGVTPHLSGGVVTANLGFMAVNTTATLSIAVRPTSAAAIQIVDQASVTSDDIDLDQTNNIATLTTPVEPDADLILSLAGAPGSVSFGDSVTYTLSATNHGPSTATSVLLTDALPQGIGAPVSVSTSVTGVTPVVAAGQVTVQIGTLAPGASATVTITVWTTIASVPEISDSARVGSPTLDPNPDNNSPSPVTTTVVYPNLQIGVDWTGSAKSITSLILSFNAPLMSSTATDAGNYTLVNVGRDGVFGTRDDQTVSLLRAPSYDASNWTVTLIPATPLRTNQFYHLVVDGSSPGGVTDLAGGKLAGAGPAYPGTNYIAMLAQGTKLRYFDSVSDKVTLTLKKGGYLKDLLSGSGEGARLVLVGEHPRRSVLTGKVARAKHTPGGPTLGYTIYGLGRFGDVRVNMTSPPFLVTRYPFSPGPTIPQQGPAALARLEAAVAHSANVAVSQKRRG
jgi:uncharacterized repeat protein (TIGR01451 family)